MSSHPEWRAAVREATALQTPQTDDELAAWLGEVAGYGFARKASCPDHNPPFSWLADVYFERQNRVAILGPRGGGKTLSSACLHWASGSTKANYRISHFGGSMQQASQCQDHLRVLASRPGAAAVLQESVLMTAVRWVNGSHLSLHTATHKQASGGHPHRKQADEFDLWSYGVWQTFLGMGAESGGHAVQTVYTSTRSRKYGLMHNLLQQAPQRGIRTYKYCIWDCKQPCLPCVKGKCGLWDYCEGRHEHSEGHISRAVLEDKAMQMDEQTVRTELFCEAPATTGLCWPTYDDMPRVGGNVTPEAEYRKDWPVFWALDDNYAEPRCVALCQEDPNTGFLHIFDEYYRRHRLASESVADVLGDKTRYPYTRPHYSIPDATAVELHGALHRANIITVKPRKYRRVEGVKVARRFFRDARGVRMLLIHPRCENIRRSITKHHFRELPAGAEGRARFSDEPAKHDDDHGAEVVSYLCWVKKSKV